MKVVGQWLGYDSSKVISFLGKMRLAKHNECRGYYGTLLHNNTLFLFRNDAAPDCFYAGYSLMINEVIDSMFHGNIKPKVTDEHTYFTSMVLSNKEVEYYKEYSKDLNSVYVWDCRRMIMNNVIKMVGILFVSSRPKIKSEHVFKNYMLTVIKNESLNDEFQIVLEE